MRCGRTKACLGLRAMLNGNPDLLAAILALEEEFGKLSPLNSITKLRALWDRSSAMPAVVLWIVEGLGHLFRSGVREFSQTSIFGDKRSGHIGWADLLTLKKEILTILLDKLDGMAPGVRPKLESHSAFRMHFTAKEPEETDRSWVGLLPPVARLHVSFIEDSIYGKDSDALMRPGPLPVSV